jgi:hypothetical protein
VAAEYSWRDDFNYATLQDMQNAGWVLENPSGTSLQAEGVVIDGTGADTVIRYRDFPEGLNNWSVETRSIWTGGTHSCPGLDVITEKHVYSFSGNGWYDDLNFDRDGVTETIGSYFDQTGWVTMSMTKIGNTINLYFNGELMKTYTEADTSPSGLLEVDRIAPWKGVMVYDYYQVTDVDVAAASGNFPILYVGIAGGVTAAVIGGAAAYWFFVAKKGAESAASAVSAAGADRGQPNEVASADLNLGGFKAGSCLGGPDSHSIKEVLQQNTDPFKPVKDLIEQQNPQKTPQQNQDKSLTDFYEKGNYNSQLKNSDLRTSEKHNTKSRAQNQPAKSDQNSYPMNPDSPQSTPQEQQSSQPTEETT